jgi:isopenicillin-N epimerase
MNPAFGRALRHLWHLAEDGVFLNHGSFGACPIEVLAEQDRIRKRMEAAPDAFFRSGVIPEQPATELRAAAAAVAGFVNAREGQIAFIENATSGVQAALRSVELGPGDEVLLTDHGYNAVRLMTEARCTETGAKVRMARIAVPASEDDVVAKVLESVTTSTRLAILDHITSPTGLLFPLERIIPELRRRNVRVLIDGAHAIGQVPLDLAALQPHWYVSNLHKWLYAPKGTALFYASDEVAGATRPNVISHFTAMGFPAAFDFMGTRDNSGWLAAPAAVAFFERFDGAAMGAHRKALLEKTTELLGSLGAQPVGPLDMCVAMRSFILPQRREASADDARDLMRDLWETERVQCHANAFNGLLLTRVSAAMYVDDADVVQWRRALDQRGWPAR